MALLKLNLCMRYTLTPHPVETGCLIITPVNVFKENVYQFFHPIMYIGKIGQLMVTSLLDALMPYEEQPDCYVFIVPFITSECIRVHAVNHIVHNTNGFQCPTHNFWQGSSHKKLVLHFNSPTRQIYISSVQMVESHLTAIKVYLLNISKRTRDVKTIYLPDHF